MLLRFPDDITPEQLTVRGGPIFFGHARSSSKSPEVRWVPGAHNLCTIGGEHTDVSSRSRKPCTRASRQLKTKPPLPQTFGAVPANTDVPEAASARELPNQQGLCFICPQLRKAAGTFTEVNHSKHWKLARSRLSTGAASEAYLPQTSQKRPGLWIDGSSGQVHDLSHF